MHTKLRTREQGMCRAWDAIGHSMISLSRPFWLQPVATHCVAEARFSIDVPLFQVLSVNSEYNMQYVMLAT